MASKVTKFAPVALVAFTLQGCIFSEFKTAVKIAIGKQCHDKANSISDAEAIKDVKAAKACEDMDQDKLTSYKVTDCASVLHDVVHFALGASCEMDVTSSVAESCHPFKGAACKTDVDKAVQQFDPKEGESAPGGAEQTAEQDGFESTLGLVQACAKVVTTALASDKAKKAGKAMCDDTDADAMKAMGVNDGHCMVYLKQQGTELGTLTCVISALMREDAPESPDDVTFDWMDKASKAYGEKLAESFEGTVEADVGSGTERLRLFQLLKQGKWPGKLRRGPSASVVAAGVASAFVSAALLWVVWRRRSTRQPTSQDIEPILNQELQPME